MQPHQSHPRVEYPSGGFSGWLSFSPCYGIVLLIDECSSLSKYANTTQMKYVLGNASQSLVVYKVWEL